MPGGIDRSAQTEAGADALSPGHAASAGPAAERATVAELTKQIGEQAQEIDRLSLQLRLVENVASALVDEAAQRKTGESLFRDLGEVGDFIAHINHRAAALARLGRPPSPGAPGYEDYQRSLDVLLRDVALVVNDPLLKNALGSGDPALVSEAQTAYVSSSLGLAPEQKHELSAILESAYGLGYERKLDAKHKPAGDATGWEAARAELNGVTVRMVEKLLTPEQLRQFERFGYQNLLFNLNLSIRTDQDNAP